VYDLFFFFFLFLLNRNIGEAQSAEVAHKHFESYEEIRDGFEKLLPIKEILMLNSIMGFVCKQMKVFQTI
jgi:hypothetical protein